MDKRRLEGAAYEFLEEQKIRKSDMIVYCAKNLASYILHLTELGLMTGWLAGRQNAEFLKSFLYIKVMDFLLCLAEVKHCYRSFNSFHKLFS